MKILFSINHKFMNNSPIDMIKLLQVYDKNNVIEGFELYFDVNNEFEKNYSYELAELCNKNNYYLQLHGDSSLEIDNQKKYLDFANSLSNIPNKKLSIVLHPLV